MKIRDLILSLLIIGMVISTGTLVAFASSGINDVKNITSEASSGELLGIASKNLEDVAISIRDSLDSQMQNQYQMVKSWALQPALLEDAKKAQSYTMEELYEMWSAKALRAYNDRKEAIGDGNPGNDLSPAVSKYLADLSTSTSYLEVSITDSRGYTIAASAATGDFDLFVEPGPLSTDIMSRNRWGGRGHGKAYGEIQVDKTGIRDERMAAEGRALISAPPLELRRCVYCYQPIEAGFAYCPHCGKRVSTTKWYYSTSAVVTGLLMLGPFALPLVWFNPRYTRLTKAVITVLILVVSGLLLYWVVQLYLQTAAQVRQILNSY